MSKNTIPMTLGDAQKAWRANNPWRVLLHFCGQNENNISGKSDKWWTAYSDGSTTAFINFGKSGSTGRAEPIVSMSYDALTKAFTKVAEGYRERIIPVPRTAPVTRKVPPPPVKKAVPQRILDLPTPFCDIRMVRSQSVAFTTKYFALNEEEQVIAEIPADSFDSLIILGDMSRVTFSEWRV